MADLDAKSTALGAALAVAAGASLLALSAVSPPTARDNMADAGSVAPRPRVAVGPPVELRDTQSRRVVATPFSDGTVEYDVRSPHDSEVTIWLRTFPATRAPADVLAAIGRDQWRDEHDDPPVVHDAPEEGAP